MTCPPYTDIWCYLLSIWLLLDQVLLAWALWRQRPMPVWPLELAHHGFQLQAATVSSSQMVRVMNFYSPSLGPCMPPTQQGFTPGHWEDRTRGSVVAASVDSQLVSWNCAPFFQFTIKPLDKKIDVFKFNSSKLRVNKLVSWNPAFHDRELTFLRNWMILYILASLPGI